MFASDSDLRSTDRVIAALATVALIITACALSEPTALVMAVATGLYAIASYITDLIEERDRA
ncbi:hypothetical protein [Corynebacterium variabile]|uniref:hypothetical protein n=1 Tax=Corynebacterium variabile TaxID=1727 RepID=UPI003FD3063D